MLKKILIMAIAFLILAAALVGYSFYSATNSLVIKNVEIPVKHLSSEKLERKIVHISDTHFDAKTPAKRVDQTIAAIKSNNPEIVFFTGDLIDKKDGMKIAADFVRRIAEFSKIYVVFGNWDYYVLNYDLSDLLDELKGTGAKILINGSDKVKIGDQDAIIIGLKNPRTTNNVKVDIDKAMADIEGDDPNLKILLAHSPEAIEVARQKGIDLYLAGHTHGGQILIPFLTDLILPVSKDFKKYLNGFYKAGDMSIYINPGLGTSTLPLRFLVPAEITVITLTKSR